MSAANPARGEAALRVAGETLVLRPSFAALVERAATGGLSLAETVALLWHCVAGRPDWLTREALGEAVVAGGLAAAAMPLRVLLGQILAGR